MRRRRYQNRRVADYNDPGLTSALLTLNNFSVFLISPKENYYQPPSDMVLRWLTSFSIIPFPWDLSLPFFPISTTKNDVKSV